MNGKILLDTKGTEMMNELNELIPPWLNDSPLFISARRRWVEPTKRICYQYHCPQWGTMACHRFILVCSLDTWL